MLGRWGNARFEPYSQLLGIQGNHDNVLTQGEFPTKVQILKSRKPWQLTKIGGNATQVLGPIVALELHQFWEQQQQSLCSLRLVDCFWFGVHLVVESPLPPSSGREELVSTFLSILHQNTQGRIISTAWMCLEEEPT